MSKRKKRKLKKLDKWMKLAEKRSSNTRMSNHILLLMLYCFFWKELAMQRFGQRKMRKVFTFLRDVAVAVLAGVILWLLAMYV